MATGLLLLLVVSMTMETAVTVSLPPPDVETASK